ncbi:hypothetical protein [Bacillus toyonensis]|uniref:hypothetical protein n=1 Tax=Bacillus toyonensis TaxID=155322 RepID=UPI000BF3EF0C|nr:hypothetical protein [Bacillus toyonensis]PGF05304.1 hypothetical protein COM61_02520 [Bacillus toyonensis]
MRVDFEVMELSEEYFYSRIAKLKKMAINRGFHFELVEKKSYPKKIEVDIEGYLHKLQVKMTSYTLDIGIPEDSNRYIEVGIMRKIDTHNTLDVNSDFANKYEVSKLPKELYTEPILCEHCGSGRVCKHTHVLYDFEEQVFFQVASGCLFEYKMYMRPINIEYMLEDLERNLADRNHTVSSRHREYYTYEDFEPIALYCLSHYMGLEKLEFISRSYAYHNKLTPTEDHIESLLADNKGVGDEVKQVYPLFLQYLTECQGDAENKNYENIIKDNTLPSFKRRPLIYLAFKYFKDKEKREQKERERKLMDEEVSNYIGEKGDKLELEVTYAKTVSYTSERFGVGYFHFFVTEDGNVLKWATAKDFNENVKEGDKFPIKFKIKGHETYRGLKQTQIFFVKVD